MLLEILLERRLSLDLKADCSTQQVTFALAFTVERVDQVPGIDGSEFFTQRTDPGPDTVAQLPDSFTGKGLAEYLPLRGLSFVIIGV